MKASVRLDILAIPESSASIVYSFYEVFSSVGRMWSFLTGEQQTAAGFDVRIVSPVQKTFFCHGGIPVIPQADLKNSADIKVIVIPDFLLDPDFLPDRNWEQAKKWLQSQYALGSVICSVCTGAVLLADTGLLNGREATTHWAAAQLIKSRCPDVRLSVEKILVAGDGDARLITAGGASSWGELALYLINRYFGYMEASRAAKIYLLGDKSDGQLPFAAIPRPKEHNDAVIEECQTWIANHYDELSPVRRMIELSGLPERTFMRRFYRATGFRPVRYVQSLRIEEAKQLLETTTDSVDDICAQVGYEDPAYFRKLFKRMAGISPTRYRTKYQAIRYLVKSAPAPGRVSSSAAPGVR